MYEFPKGFKQLSFFGNLKFNFASPPDLKFRILTRFVLALCEEQELLKKREIRISKMKNN